MSGSRGSDRGVVEESPVGVRPVPLILRRGLGLPWLFALSYSLVGSAIYFALGVVAERGLGLTPLLFLVAGGIFVLTLLTYVEAGSMLREPGGSSSFARHAFNELVSFIAGWAILIDYVIVIALAAVTVPHYLGPVSHAFGEWPVEPLAITAVVALIAALNVAGVTGRFHQRGLALLALGDVALQVLVIGVGAAVALDPAALTAQLDFPSAPSVEDLAYAGVIAMVAYAGIEAASNLAGDIDVPRRDLRRGVAASAALIPLVYAGMAAIALMAVPVLPGPDGPATALGGALVEAPVLGVVEAYEPSWIAAALRWPVALIGPAMLIWAAYTAMLGLSRLAYVLATNRQIPSWLGKLSRRRGTPYVTILSAAVLALALALPGDVRFLVGLYAFGTTLSMTIAHLAVLRLRMRRPDAERPYRIPFNVTLRGRSYPVPAIAGALIGALAWLSVIAFHEGARYLGLGWLAVGVLFYIGYRRYEGTTLTRRVTVPAEALKKIQPDVEYGSILVPVFGEALDDDIVSTAGRLAEAGEGGSDGESVIDVLYVVQVPLALPLDGELPPAWFEAGERALGRAREVGEEYQGVRVETLLLRARSVGSGIVEEARRRNPEVIMMSAEPPSRVRGGALLGGVEGARPLEIGEATRYVLAHAPCRVLLTAAPPADRPSEPEATTGTL